MSADTTVTQRTAILREREAFERGWMRNASLDEAFAFDVKVIRAIAKQKFPMPVIVRPRVVKDDIGDSWRLVDGKYEFMDRHRARWEAVEPAWKPSLVLVGVWADLLANPTEEVEADA